VQQLRDLLECAWPAVMAASVSQFDSTNWCAALAVVLERCNGDPHRLARLGLARFTAAVRRELPRWGGQRLWGRMWPRSLPPCLIRPG
jgi:transposase